MRTLIALGGNAMTASDGRARPEDQIAAVGVAMEAVADLVAAGVEVVLTHGNGPQVGNLLVKNELAAHVVPPVPLDWCGAQTQGTLGFVIVSALERALAARGVAKPVAAVVTRTLVDANDRGFTHPTKPIGRYLPKEQAVAMIAHGQTWEDRGERGWRRVVASPEPLEVLDAAAAKTLVEAGYVVVACGGGGIPMVHDLGSAKALRGVEAVIDKDLSAVLLARAVGADHLVIATDVDHMFVHFGTPDVRALDRIDVADLRAHLAAGEFGGGSMAPKAEAACRFVEGGGRRAVVTALGSIREAVLGEAGTVVEGATSA
ncbi:Carbamate kinase [Catenulispora acidiphila DSM 44928]|uniref:Carbamate kinase n=1 Tax=Catenulispora acidiphila (strain DSM 44928 / JCM 14897 / NBRC 102108 / NRRL B-24433 / ID139908) TaxID=479433 RepID=C7QEA7_CATAD|nr:carbamate kinase [Catenulispora acidiphila]ACU70798.1 Carbamate kinase [Catenulispora acidiphila DSM 44928]